MHSLLTIPIITLLFILARASDLAISYGITRSYARCIAYSIVALLALIVVLITLVGLHG